MKIFLRRRRQVEHGHLQKTLAPVVNTSYHDSSVALSADGNTLFIFNDEGGGDIFYSERQPGGEFAAKIPLPGIINSSFEEKSISISKDEKTLYFSSNRPGGFGGLDIYKATKDAKGEWTNVKNLVRKSIPIWMMMDCSLTTMM